MSKQQKRDQKAILICLIRDCLDLLNCVKLNVFFFFLLKQQHTKWQFLYFIYYICRLYVYMVYLELFLCQLTFNRCTLNIFKTNNKNDRSLLFAAQMRDF